MIVVLDTHGYNALPFSHWTNAAVIDPIENRLAEFRQQDRMKTGSLIVSIFGDAILPRGGRVWLGSLIRLLEPLQLITKPMIKPIKGKPIAIFFILAP